MENHGEIKGSILNQPTIGNVNKNSVFGIYGDLTSLTSLNIDTSKALKVALRNEIKEGKATMLCNVDGNKTKEYEALERISYYFTGGYVFNFNDKLKFKPAFMAKATNGAPIALDLTANFLFNEKFWLGGSYRMNKKTAAIGGIIDFQVSRQLRIGYAYEKPISDIARYTTGTHEVLLMYEFKFLSSKLKSPRYF